MNTANVSLHYLHDDIFFKGFENSFSLACPVCFPEDVEMLCKVKQCQTCLYCPTDDVKIKIKMFRGWNHSKCLQVRKAHLSNDFILLVPEKHST